MAELNRLDNGCSNEIIGYVQPWIASPGNSVDVKVSSTEAEIHYSVVRLIHGPHGTDFSAMKQENIASIPGGKCGARYQLAYPGSYGVVSERHYQINSSGLQVSLHFQPHLLGAKHDQTLFSTLNISNKSGISVGINSNDMLEFWVGTGAAIEVVATEFMPVLRTWTKLSLTIEGATLTYEISSKSSFTEIVAPIVRGAQDLVGVADIFQPCTVLLAASFAETPVHSSAAPTNFFSGRLDSPVMATAGPDGIIIAEWDFSRNISSDEICDVSGNGADGRLINAPTRAVTGHDWDATESDWTKAQYGYGAIHFHETDLDDAGWETTFTIELPKDLRSGVYAVQVQGSGTQTSDMVPFFVRPTASTTASLGSKVAYIISTFTYLAYANEHVYDRTDIMSVAYDWEIRRDEHALKTERRLDLGLSCYDMHNDRSGVIHSSAKRPILNMRPDYISWNFHRPRGLSADLIGLEFLEKSCIPFDVVCDHDLHTLGKDAISHYSTVITGSHPEYHSLESLCAYRDYLKSGGNLMYLGGNGFYWSCAVPSASPHRVEIRRGDQGCRAFTQPGGDRVFSSNGQQGLLWRSRGLASNYLVGVGCCACGSGPGVPYRRTEASKNPALAWMFTGIAEDALIGVEGFAGGASGDEIDRCDYRLGSPLNAIVVATSTGHPDEFGIFPEDAEFPMLKTTGTQTNEIRSDITYYETNGGGAVFSVGSINWFCSLGWNKFENEVAQLTGWANILLEDDCIRMRSRTFKAPERPEPYLYMPVNLPTE